jgi:hypothetical protein
MNTTSYDHAALAAQATPPGERIPGPPSGGLIFLWIGWLLAAALMIGLGGAVFLGILETVSGAG